jgi:hypothetical protein
VRRNSGHVFSRLFLQPSVEEGGTDSNFGDHYSGSAVPESPRAWSPNLIGYKGETMKTLRVFLSLLFLGVVLSFGLARLVKAEEEGGARCNCYLPNQQKYGVANLEGTQCVVDPNCFILIP